MDTGINLVILVAGSLGMCVGAYALNRNRRKPLPVAEAPRATEDAPDELELLRYENAMLRADQHRSMSLGKAGERVRDDLGAIAPGVTSGSDEGDDAWTALTEATVLRDTMLTVCRDLQAAIHNVEVQLSSGVPITELDRRRTDRAQQGAVPAHADHALTRLPDLTRIDLSVAGESGS